MKVPLRWLEEMIDLPTRDVEELGYVFDMLGHKVEGVERFEIDWSDVYVGRVVDIAAHPDADRIRVCQVDTGSGLEQIICGAWNFENGALVAVARPGAVLPGGFEIRQRTIRGVVSNGMICSEKELGLGDDHEGILVLDGGPEVGAPFSDLLELPDVVFDLEITPNRPDVMSILGVARDLAAHYDIGFRAPDPGLVAGGGVTAVRVEVEDPSGCRRFTLREITGVNLGRSPLWMRHRLEKVGVRPISNVVDVTNYVMFELGHPLHAFDADSVVGDRLVVRRAGTGETLVTLDHVERDLEPGDLIIYDDAGPTSMSGTMGGARSEVSGSTTRVLMEAASWDPPTIMFMSRRHDLRSEASTRFERGVDPGLADLANQRAAALVAALAGGEVLSGSVDVITTPITPLEVDLTGEEVERVLGPGFDDDLVASLLSRLGMGVEGRRPMRVTVPTYRPDVSRKVDLIEEVARIHGYDRFDATVPRGPIGGLTSVQKRLRRLVATLAGAGLDQAINLPFVGLDDLNRLGLRPAAGDLLTVRNPLREEESRLRPSLLPGLLNTARYNLSHGADSVAFFETGSVFHTEPAEWDHRLPDQPERLAWVVQGDVGIRLLESGTRVADATTSLALWELVAASLGIETRLASTTSPGFHPARTASVIIEGRGIGHVGELSPLAARAFELPGRVAIAEIDLTSLLGPVPPRMGRSLSVFPHVDFDLSFRVDADLPAADLVEATNRAVGDLLEHSRVFDEFRDPSLGEGKKALAIRYRLRAPDRTLAADEIGVIRDEMISAAISVGGELRGA